MRRHRAHQGNLGKFVEGWSNEIRHWPDPLLAIPGYILLPSLRQLLLAKLETESERV
jgi:hypothetical protein